VGRRIRLAQPPSQVDRGLDEWLRRVTDVINEFPNFTMGETSDGPEDEILGDTCDLFFDVGSSATTCIWAKTSDNTTSGWRAIDLV